MIKSGPNRISNQIRLAGLVSPSSLVVERVVLGGVLAEHGALGAEAHALPLPRGGLLAVHLVRDFAQSGSTRRDCIQLSGKYKIQGAPSKDSVITAPPSLLATGAT